MAYTNSGLVNYTRISPNKTVNRNHMIDRITPHCYVGQVSVEDMGAWFVQGNAQASCNYGIGKDGRVGLFVEEKDRSWCSSSRENDNRAVTIECASDKKDPYKINDVVYNKLIELCVDICRRNGKDILLWFGDKAKTIAYQPKSNEMLLSVHRWFANKACPGEYIYSRLGNIAEEVTKRLGGDPISTPDKYVVRLSFDQPKTQTNSYNNLDYAKAEANRYPGYSVYETATGKCIYTSPKDNGYTPDEWIAMIAPIAQDLARKNGILPSVIIGQTCVETGFGKTDLTRKYNIVGMKAELLNSTWQQYSVWDGETYGKDSPEESNGVVADKYSLFRVYKSFRQCLEDYEQFLLHVSNSKGLKYARIRGWTDPVKVINAIRIGTGTNSNPEGYATDSKYETKVLNYITTYDLTQFDSVMSNSSEPVVEAVDRYAVLRSLIETQFRLGLYSNLENAKRQADMSWGYKVFDICTDKLVYEPTLTLVEKLIGKCIQFNDFIEWDNKNGHQWRYFNNKRSALTFWVTRDEGLYITNCMGAVSFAMQDIGIPASALRWYGTKGGIYFFDDKAKKEAEKYFDFIVVKTKTVKQCIADGTILPGDTITYMNMSHTNIYIGVDMAYDAGHAFCEGSGEGAKYQRWIGPVPHGTAKVAVIARLKTDTRKTYYRIQINAFDSEKNANRCAVKCKELTGYDGFVEKLIDGKWHVFCGEGFTDIKSAEERLKFVKEHGYPKAFIKTV